MRLSGSVKLYWLCGLGFTAGAAGGSAGADASGRSAADAEASLWARASSAAFAARRLSRRCRATGTSSPNPNPEVTSDRSKDKARSARAAAADSPPPAPGRPRPPPVSAPAAETTRPPWHTHRPGFSPSWRAHPVLHAIRRWGVKRTILDMAVSPLTKPVAEKHTGPGYLLFSH